MYEVEIICVCDEDRMSVLNQPGQLLQVYAMGDDGLHRVCEHVIQSSRDTPSSFLGGLIIPDPPPRLGPLEPISSLRFYRIS